MPGLHRDDPARSCRTAVPRRTRWNLGRGHVHVHARAQARFADRGTDAAAATKKATISPLRQQALIDSLSGPSRSSTGSLPAPSATRRQHLVRRRGDRRQGRPRPAVPRRRGRKGRAGPAGTRATWCGSRLSWADASSPGTSTQPPWSATTQVRRDGEADPAAAAGPGQPEPGPWLGRRGALGHGPDERRRRAGPRPDPSHRDRAERAASGESPRTWPCSRRGS